VSLGGGISYSELFLSRSGNNLVFETGVTDRITFKDWYASSTNRSVATLQVIAEAMAGYPSAGDPLLGAKVEQFNFMTLVQAFDAARAANANITRWQLMDELLTAHLAASDTEALGGGRAVVVAVRDRAAGIAAAREPGAGGAPAGVTNVDGVRAGTPRAPYRPFAPATGRKA
jgi:hypothetical protein